MRIQFFTHLRLVLIDLCIGALHNVAAHFLQFPFHACVEQSISYFFCHACIFNISGNILRARFKIIHSSFAPIFGGWSDIQKYVVASWVFTFVVWEVYHWLIALIDICRTNDLASKKGDEEVYSNCHWIEIGKKMHRKRATHAKNGN
jgi:hypothetical protein